MAVLVVESGAQNSGAMQRGAFFAGYSLAAVNTQTGTTIPFPAIDDVTALAVPPGRWAVVVTAGRPQTTWTVACDPAPGGLQAGDVLHCQAVFAVLDVGPQGNVARMLHVHVVQGIEKASVLPTLVAVTTAANTPRATTTTFQLDAVTGSGTTDVWLGVPVRPNTTQPETVSVTGKASGYLVTASAGCTGALDTGSTVVATCTLTYWQAGP